MASSLLETSEDPANISALPAAAASPFRQAQAKYFAASARFASLPRDLETSDHDRFLREESAFLQSAIAAQDAPVADWEEFADAFEISCDFGDSMPSERGVTKLLEDARRLRATPTLIDQRFRG